MENDVATGGERKGESESKLVATGGGEAVVATRASAVESLLTVAADTSPALAPLRSSSFLNPKPKAASEEAAGAETAKEPALRLSSKRLVRCKASLSVDGVLSKAEVLADTFEAAAYAAENFSDSDPFAGVDVVRAGAGGRWTLLEAVGDANREPGKGVGAVAVAEVVVVVSSGACA